MWSRVKQSCHWLLLYFVVSSSVALAQHQTDHLSDITTASDCQVCLHSISLEDSIVSTSLLSLVSHNHYTIQNSSYQFITNKVPARLTTRAPPAFIFN